MSIRICRDCKWVNNINKESTWWVCGNPKTATKSLIDGNIHSSLCSFERTGYNCGPEGKLWEPIIFLQEENSQKEK